MERYVPGTGRAGGPMEARHGSHAAVKPADGRVDRRRLQPKLDDRHTGEPSTTRRRWFADDLAAASLPLTYPDVRGAGGSGYTITHVGACSPD
jgi:hypothetical protein